MACGESVRAPVVIVPYDSSWPSKFEMERDRLQQALGKWIVGGIEHVGSTAIHGLSAKPVIDIMVGVESLAASRPLIPVVSALGYEYWDYKGDVMHWFCRPCDAFRTHHLHLIPYGSRLWQDRLVFRDALRANALLASEYDALKRELSEKYRHDREAYTEAKLPFVMSVLQR